METYNTTRYCVDIRFWYDSYERDQDDALQAFLDEMSFCPGDIIDATIAVS